MLGAEGTVRLVATVVLVRRSASHAPGAYGLALVLPPIVAMVDLAARAEGPARARARPRRTPSCRRRSAGCSLGSVLCQALSYAAYIAAIVLAEAVAGQTSVGNFTTGILIARIPLLGFQAVQAALLRSSPRLAGAGEDDEFRKALRQLVMIVLAVGVIGVVGGFAVGHIAGRCCSARSSRSSNRDVGLLAIGSGAFIFALTLAQALIALRSYAAPRCRGSSASSVRASARSSPHDLFLRSELSFGVGAIVRGARDAGVPRRAPAVRRPAGLDGAPA